MTKAEQEWSLIEALVYCKGKRLTKKSCAGCPYAEAGCAIDATIAKLKAQEPRVMTLEELAFYDSGLYVETHNGCPEGLTDELWPALVHLYCVSQNGEYGYVSFINWNADTYDFEAKDYNVEFRCWTSRPDEKRREETPWE